MPKISTLSRSKHFEYTPDGQGGFYIEYTGRPHITKALIDKIKKQFNHKTVPAGVSRTEPIPGGFGEWIRDTSPFTPMHGSHIAAVLKDLDIIKDSFGKKPIMLKF